VFATAATSAGIRDTAEPKRAYWTPIIGADYPQTFAFPDQPLASGDTLGIDGIELTVTDFGAAECADNTAVALPQADAVIISDLVYNRVHPWLAEGRVQPWLDALRRAQSLFAGAATLYAGHGPSGPHAILADQITYIEAMREAAATAPSKTVVRDRMLALFPNFELANLVDLNADALRQ
jgi:glyoxylase-like metal-dependent hydrolase (beta-lactamase superfamily II)